MVTVTTTLREAQCNLNFEIIKKCLFCPLGFLEPLLYINVCQELSCLNPRGRAGTPGRVSTPIAAIGDSCTYQMIRGILDMLLTSANAANAANAQIHQISIQYI